MAVVKVLQKWSGQLSIRVKIISLMLLGIIGIGIVSFAISFFAMRSILTQRICETNSSTVETMASRIDEVFGNSTSAVVGISIDESIRSQVSNLYSEQETEVIHAMNALRSSLSNYTYTIVNIPASIAMLTADGTMIYNGDSPGQSNIAFRQDVFRQYITRFSFQSISGQIPIKEYLPNPLSPSTDDLVYCIAMPMRSLDEAHTVIIMMLIHTRHMMPYLTAGDESWHTRVLTDANDQIVMSDDPALLGQNITDLTGGGMPANGARTAGGDGYLFRRRLHSFNGTVYDLMDSSYIESELWTAARNLLLLDMAAMMVMVLVATLLSNSIIRPIVRLSERMAEREYASLARDTHLMGGNEVRVLEYSFDVMQENIRQLIELNHQREQEKRRTEIKALQSQIRPHFLFNTLNTVRCAIQNHNSDKAESMILALSGLLRMTLVNGEELIPLWQELETLQYYQDIMSMRSSMHFTTVYQVEAGLEDYRIPKLLLQPLVENSILHGFRCRKKDGELCVAAATEADGVHIMIVDNGGALEEPPPQPDSASRRKRTDSFSGIGLGNIRRRVQLYYGPGSQVRLYRFDDTHTAAELLLPFPNGTTTITREEVL